MKCNLPNFVYTISTIFNFSTTWDEHIFELTLPRSCCVGHVDVKFSLHSLPSMATEIQVTLLKLNSSGIGKRDKQIGSKAVDDGINFKLSGTLIVLFVCTNISLCFLFCHRKSCSE
jgi:hypothetical protein